MFRNKIKGWEALVKELGHSGATQFILLCEKGEGDYMKERKKMLKRVTIEKIVDCSFPPLKEK
ncbi:MAG: hypothetical protein FIA94_12355 [Nitrospirae bacterium]|nr:hypothetical protein [Nitrospirota bacterium]